MYALHPGSLPPALDNINGPRVQVSAAELAKRYKLEPWEYIVWGDGTDGYDFHDFIHLYPDFYGRYSKEPPCVKPLSCSGARRAGKASRR